MDFFALESINFNLNSTQQLGELRFLQGKLTARLAEKNAFSADLLAGMAVKSQQAAAEAMKTQRVPGRRLTQYNYQAGLDLLQQLSTDAIEQQTLNASILQQLHQALNRKGGQWRSARLKLQRADQPEQPLIIPATTDSLSEPLDALFQQWNQCQQRAIEPLISVPLLALHIMRQFPFADGNSRVILLLIRHLLSHSGHPVVNYVDFESEVAATRRSFYRSLHLGTLNEQIDINPWFAYWWVLLRRLYQRFDRQIEHANIAPGRGSKTELIQRFVKQRQQPFSFGEVCKAFPTISSEQVRMTLRKLRNQHQIRSEGHGRGAVWIKIE